MFSSIHLRCIGIVGVVVSVLQERQCMHNWMERKQHFVARIRKVRLVSPRRKLSLWKLAIRKTCQCHHCISSILNNLRDSICCSHCYCFGYRILFCTLFYYPTNILWFFIMKLKVGNLATVQKCWVNSITLDESWFCVFEQCGRQFNGIEKWIKTCVIFQLLCIHFVCSRPMTNFHLLRRWKTFAVCVWLAKIASIALFLYEEQ